MFPSDIDRQALVVSETLRRARMSKVIETEYARVLKEFQDLTTLVLKQEQPLNLHRQVAVLATAIRANSWWIQTSASGTDEGVVLSIESNHATHVGANFIFTVNEDHPSIVNMREVKQLMTADKTTASWLEHKVDLCTLLTYATYGLHLHLLAQEV